MSDSPSDAVTREQALARTRSYLELLQQQRWDEWIDLWAQDAVLEFPYAPKGRPRIYRGRRDILEYMSGTTRSIVVDSVADLRVFPMLDPQTVVVELGINGHLIGNGAPYDQRYVTFFEFEDGKIRHYREYWNPLISIEAHGGHDAWTRAFSEREEA